MLSTKYSDSKTQVESGKMGACVAQSVNHPTLDLSSGLDLRFKSHIGSMLGVKTKEGRKKKWKNRKIYFMQTVTKREQR